MDAQKLFDTVAIHMLSQHRRASSGWGRPEYHAKASNDRCAIGCLIPDTIYHRKIEHKSVPQLLVSKDWRIEPTRNHLQRLAGEHPKNRYLLEILQTLHDHVYAKYWKTGFRTIATAFGLKTDVLNRFRNPRARGVAARLRFEQEEAKQINKVTSYINRWSAETIEWLSKPDVLPTPAEPVAAPQQPVEV